MRCIWVFQYFYFYFSFFTCYFFNIMYSIIVNNNGSWLLYYICDVRNWGVHRIDFYLDCNWNLKERGFFSDHFLMQIQYNLKNIYYGGNA